VPGDAFLGDEDEKVSEDPIEFGGGGEFVERADEFFGDGFGVKDLGFLFAVEVAEGFVSFGAEHSATAAIECGELATVFRGEKTLLGCRWFFRHCGASPFPE
jgi:hypothetical protein